MSIDEIRAEIEALGGVLVLAPEPGDGSPEISWGDLFFYYAPDGVLPQTQPFATIVTKEYPDEQGSGLERPGAFRLNVAAGSVEFRRRTGHDPAEPAAGEGPVGDDVVRPHPVYGQLGWLCVVNPGPRTATSVRELVSSAHGQARTRYDRRAAADASDPVPPPGRGGDPRTTCCVVGGGPAGMVLGLLLARCGVPTTVLEKHADFLRDFRGDTVHASTLTLLDELGLGPAFAELPARYVTSIDVALDSGVYPFADLSRLPGPHRHLALVPQWDLLDLLARAAAAEPDFILRTEAEVTGLRQDGGRVSGVTYRHRGGEQVLDADLVVGCDGRGSTTREQSGLAYRRFGVPMDVLWFRLSRSEVDPVGGFGRFSRGCLIVLIDRGSYFQVGFVIRKGSYARLREQGIEAFRERLGTQLPFLADRVAELGSFDDVRLLDVQLGRLRRWATDGLLLIGDAAHAMSPVGGVGINLAIQDAVATARLLAPALQAGTVSRSDLRAVQRRRWLPTVLTQTAQQVAHRLVVARAVEEQPEPRPAARRPLLIAVLDRLPALRAVPAYFVSIGVRPEEPPPAAVRRNASSEARPV